jgi:hypothetical protein
VDRPPPGKVAYKVFFRKIFFQKKPEAEKNNGNKNGYKKWNKKGNKNSGKFVKNNFYKNNNNNNKKQSRFSAPPQSVDKSSKILSSTSISFGKASNAKSKPTPSTRAAAVIEEKQAISPQSYLDDMIAARGYSTEKFKTLQTAYYNKPTALQQASYDVYLIDLVKKNGVETLRNIFKSGVSPNPCNTFGESLLHMICRRGDVDLLKVLLECGTNLQVADDYGRTPLHDACWAAKPAFAVVDLILERDPRLLYMSDCRGALPLSYVRKEHWCEWVPYLEARKHTYWPVLTNNTDTDSQAKAQAPPLLCTQGANTRPLRDPKDALTCEMAKMVVSGKMQPDEAQFLKYDVTDEDDESRSSSEAEEDAEESGDESGSEGSGSGTESDSDDDSEYDSEDDASDFSLDEDEMASILNTLAPRAASVEKQ